MHSWLSDWSRGKYYSHNRKTIARIKIPRGEKKKTSSSFIKKPGPGVPCGLDLATKRTLKWIRERFLQKLSTFWGGLVLSKQLRQAAIRENVAVAKTGFVLILHLDDKKGLSHFAKINLSMHFKFQPFSKCFLTAAFSQCLRYIWSFIFLQSN